MPNLSNLMNGIGGTGIRITTVVFIALALFFLWRALAGRRRVREAMNWQQTTGTVLSSEVETRRSRSGQSGYSTSYYPRVVYEYEVMGQRYRSNQFNLGEVGLGFYNRVAAKVAEYPQGKMIDVYYNPNNPSEAVLERTSPRSKVFLFVVVFILALLACTTAMTMGGLTMVSRFIQDTFPR
jgi:hypothetical protein